MGDLIKDFSIKEGNHLIAKFMGSEYVNLPYFDKEKGETINFWQWTKPVDGFPRCAVTGQEWSTAVIIGNFKYHASWDWLLPVVRHVLYSPFQCTESNLLACYDLGFTIETVFNMVVEYIKAYNKQAKLL